MFTPGVYDIYEMFYKLNLTLVSLIIILKFTNVKKWYTAIKLCHP